MAGTPDGGPPNYGAAGMQQQAQYLGALGQMLGAGGRTVAPFQGYQTTAPGFYVMAQDGLHFYPHGQMGLRPVTPALSVAEFAEEYYEQCFGTSRTPQERAYELLMEHLSEEEKNEWWDTGRITVMGKSGRRYWISGTDCGRDDGHTFCVYIGMNECPAEDRVLGLKLAIQADEAQFLKTAVDRGVSGLARGQWTDIQRAAMQGGIVGRLVDPQRAMNEIFNAAIGQYNGVVFHETEQRVPWPMRTRLYRRFINWLRDAVAEGIRGA